MSRVKSLEHEILVVCRRDKRVSLDRICAVLSRKYTHQEVRDEVAKLLKNGAISINITVSYSPMR